MEYIKNISIGEFVEHDLVLRWISVGSSFCIGRADARRQEEVRIFGEKNMTGSSSLCVLIAIRVRRHVGCFAKELAETGGIRHTHEMGDSFECEICRL